MKHGEKVTELNTNRFGIKFSVELVYCERDDNGSPVNDWMISERGAAKMIAYRDAKRKLTRSEENAEVERILKYGVMDTLKSLKEGAL